MYVEVLGILYFNVVLELIFMFCNKLKLGNIKKKLMIGLFGFKYSYWLIMENKI